MEEDRTTRLRRLHERLESAREEGDEPGMLRLESLIASVEREIKDEGLRQRMSWGDDDMAIKRDG